MLYRLQATPATKAATPKGVEKRPAGEGVVQTLEHHLYNS